MTETTVASIGLLATILCSNQVSVIPFGAWPTEDPCPSARIMFNWPARCGIQSTSGTPIVTGYEPCLAKDQKP